MGPKHYLPISILSIDKKFLNCPVIFEISFLAKVNFRGSVGHPKKLKLP